ncbi:hypothetical protein B0H11DRAFT_1991182 [Mycena galericulata]|nr:hypothetical protein B0H11DRAFT_1991182 [Mycena galericulata]
MFNTLEDSGEGDSTGMTRTMQDQPSDSHVVLSVTTTQGQSRRKNSRTRIRRDPRDRTRDDYSFPPLSGLGFTEDVHPVPSSHEVTSFGTSAPPSSTLPAASIQLTPSNSSTSSRRGIPSRISAPATTQACARSVAGVGRKIIVPTAEGSISRCEVSHTVGAPGNPKSRKSKRRRSTSTAPEERSQKRARLHPNLVKSHSGHLTLTDEQAVALAHAKDQNIVILGQAGSGKTFLAREIAAHYSSAESRTLVITFHRDSFRDPPPHTDVLTLNQLATQLYPGCGAYTSEGLGAVRLKKILPRWNGRSYDRVLIDDIQSSTDDSYWLLHCFLAALGGTPLLAVLGYPRQTFVGYPIGDVRFVKHASKLFGPSYAWCKVSLDTSLRLSHQTAAYINHTHLRPPAYLRGSHDGLKPLVFDVDFDRRNYHAVADRLVPLVREHINSCFLTAPRVQDLGPYHPVVWILNRFTRHGIHVQEPTSDRMPPIAQHLSGKVAVLNYNQTRGHQFELIIVFWTERHGKGLLIPLTRASQRLVVIHSTEFCSLPQTQMSQYAEITRIPQNAPNRPRRQPTHFLSEKPSVSEIVRNIPGTRLVELLAKHGIVVHATSPPLPQIKHILPRDLVRTDSEAHRYESVGDLNGDVVTIAFQSYHRITKSGAPAPTALPFATLARKAIDAQAARSGLVQRKTALADQPLNWMEEDQLLGAVERLAAQFLLHENLSHEQPLSYRLDIEGHSVTISGCADVVSETSSGVAIWEIKLVATLLVQHVVQVLLYGFLYAAKQEGRTVLPRMVLFNVSDGQKLEVSGNLELENVKAFVFDLIRALRTPQERRPCEGDFLCRCGKTRAEVEGILLNTV